VARWTGGLFAALLPGPCVLCGDRAGADGWCAPCLAALPGRDQPRCPRCALPGTRGVACGRCLARPPSCAHALAAVSYAFPVDAMVSQFKYARNLALAAPLGALLCEALRAQAQRPDVVVPVPIGRARLRQRGFNQAAELARVVADTFRLELDTRAATRRDADPPQASLPLRERARRIKGAFVCARALRGARVALVDDVMTSGATLDELGAAVLAAGAREVHCWVLARTPEPGQPENY